MNESANKGVETLNLDERKRRILRAIIDDYINFAEPVGSRTIARKHELGLSSATIRNEMSDLEELGFLFFFHTSAGRIPSDKGYRLYVDELMKLESLTEDEIISIKKAMEVKINELSQLLKQASAIMSRITRYTSMAVTPGINEIKLKAVQLVPIDTVRALVIVVTGAGTVKNSMIQLPKIVPADYIITVSNILNEKLSGLNVEEINSSVVSEIERIIDNDILEAVFTGIDDCIKQIEDSEVYLDGTTNIFNFPEFSDVIKAKEFLSILDGKEILCKLLVRPHDCRGITIKIGTENDVEEIRDYSLITATYSMNERVLGSIGIIGPTRMEYSKVVSSLNYMRKRINEDILRIFGEKLDET